MYISLSLYIYIYIHIHIDLIILEALPGYKGDVIKISAAFSKGSDV